MTPKRARLLGLLLPVAIACATPVAAQSAEMPAVTRFPAEASLIICPDLPSGQRLLRDFHLGANYRFDEPLLERGLKETRCRWSNGPFRVLRAIDMKFVFENRLLFTGMHGAANAPVVGIVNLTVATALPQTQLDEWLRIYAPGRRLSIAAEGDLAYVCPDLAAARRVLAAIPPRKRNPISTFESPTDRSEFERALLQNDCPRTRGTYRVEALHELRYIKLPGRSTAENWQLVEATSADGDRVGLLFDLVRGFYARRRADR